MWIIDEFRKLLVRRNHKDSLFCVQMSSKILHDDKIILPRTH